ncbi:MAG: DUF2752 domain-containing protein [Candidatus Glassbacteria bacterium]|nr:DUF2752 domain-containing protein [Candidatus Glassbacteria bacterium]
MPGTDLKQGIELPGEKASRKRQARRLFLFLALVLGISFAVDARTSTLIPRTCIWQHFTGLPCPFCGLTRSLLEISHGRLTSALDYHLFGPLVYAAGITALVLSFYSWVSGGKTLTGPGLSRVSKWAAALVGLLWLVWWVWRLAGRCR